MELEADNIHCAMFRAALLLDRLETSMMEANNYPVRYCAFVDVLGFRELLRRLNASRTAVNEIRTLLATVHNPPGPASKMFKGSDFRAQSISDAVVLSAENSLAGISHILHALEELSLAILQAGFFIRGALVKGRLYHDSQMVFGEALVNAYHLESQVARFPRVMVTSEIIDELPELINTGKTDWSFRWSFESADDGPWHLDVLKSVVQTVENESKANPGKYNRDVFETYAAMRTQIQRRLSDATDNPQHYEKVRWLANYWNERVPHGIRELTVFSSGVKRPLPQSSQDDPRR
jgi:hypothetical protein